MDTQLLMKGIRATLSKTHPQIAKLLEGASCEVQEGWCNSAIRAGIPFATFFLYVQEKYLNEFDDSFQPIVLQVADKVFPKKEQLSLDYIEVAAFVPGLHDDLLTNVTDSSGTMGHRPVWGVPSTDEQFQCDVFVIMPFKGEFEDLYKKTIIPSMSELRLTVKRGDDPYSEHEIMHDVWTLLNLCRLVIADCTRQNPNVFYELGIAHTIGKPVIQITQDDLDALPFDIRNRRTIRYSIQSSEIGKFRNELIRSVSRLLSIEDDLPF